MHDKTAGPLRGGRVSYLFLTARDLDGMVRFYRDTLGLIVYFSQKGVCAFLRTERDQEPAIALYAGKEGPPPSQRHWFFVIDVPDIRSAAADLAKRGVEIGEIEDVPGGRAAKFNDPEGNVIQVHEAA